MSEDSLGAGSPRFLLLQDPDDLLFGEPALLHLRLPQGADSSQNWRSFRGSGHRQIQALVARDGVARRTQAQVILNVSIDEVFRTLSLTFRA